MPTMMTAKYFTAQMPANDPEYSAGYVLVRSSLNRNYSHAILRRASNGFWMIASCAGNADLAQKRYAEVLREEGMAADRVAPVTMSEVPKTRLKSLAGGRAILIDEQPAPAKKPAAKKPTAPVANTTKVMYDTMYAAYDHFNAALFSDTPLPPVVLLVHRKRNAHGYFWQDQWVDKGGETKMAEIALNPETMGGEVRDVMSTLVHEMVHQWDAIHGTVPTSGHGKTWADKMDEVGLTPTSTGKPGGKRTGRKVTHMIVDDGPFAAAYDDLLKTKPDFSWFSPPKLAARKKDLSKVKHSCPECGTNIWGKQGLNVVCGDCDIKMEEA